VIHQPRRFTIRSPGSMMSLVISKIRKCDFTEAGELQTP
jgi:hypothetical protein